MERRSAERIRRGAGGRPVLGLGLAATALAALAAAARPAAAVELFEDRLQVHGFYELQLRAIARDFDASDDWDLTQMAHVLNLELEAQLAPDGVGPFDLVTAFARVEVRYDCVWRRACGLFPSVDAFGDGAKKLPKRLNDGRRSGLVGNVVDGDVRHYRGEPPETFRLAFRDMPRGSRRPFGIESTEAFGTLFTSPGADGVLGSPDDPGPFFFDRYFDAGSRRCKFSTKKVQGPENGVGWFNLGPLDPQCRPEPIAAFADKPNPFRAGDVNPLTGTSGGGELPFRPAPRTSWLEDAPDDVARGLWVPNPELRRLLREGKLEPFPHFDQQELAWNRGLSQGEEKELKELYLDLELFDSRLWLRVGKQTIVWGKTELFRNQDQFNPQDLALSTLPTLEESRTALWAVRAIWSFYDVGPLQDVRLELAVNYDQFEPADLGQCGEPYTVYLVCAGAFGIMAHGFEGLGLAGVSEPPNPWNSWKGIEAGARLEFRWDRFSFALSDFYGYDDIPHVRRIFRFERNVDPRTGRPRRAEGRGRCRTGREEACLGPGEDALLWHHANLTLFTKNCAATFGFIALDSTACGLSIFNSQVLTDPDTFGAPRLMIALTNVLSGQLTTPGGARIFEGLAMFNQRTLAQLNRFPWINRFNSAMMGGFGPNTPTPLVPLSRDVPSAEGEPAAPDDPFDFSVALWVRTGLDPYLTDEQEALLGCGPFWQTDCDLDGIDLLNAEASALFQSFVGIEGTAGDWDTTDRRRAQPGTVGFRGGPVCTRFEDARIRVLPGCRGRGDRGYSPAVDGTTTGDRRLQVGPIYGGAFRRVHPFTGQAFRSEMAVLSWNLMMTLVGFSMPDDPRRPLIDEFDPDQPFRRDGCSFAKPQLCKSYADFWSSVGTQRNVVRAGGNGRYGRRDFLWHQGNPVSVHFEKRNVLGFSMDFAEDWAKSNWSFEMTWVEGLPYSDADVVDGLTDVDTYNLTISVDRPTFVNFLNANRTFFFNAQLFLQWIDGYQESFSANGPWNTLVTFTVQTGYFQDRLLPSLTMVYDVRSSSGALLPQVLYRFTENLSASFGVALFAGRFQEVDMSVNPIATRNRAGPDAYSDFVENGLSVIRDRDEVYLRLRYTF